MALAAKPDIKLSAEDALALGAGAPVPARKSRTALKVLLALVAITAGLGGIWIFFGPTVMEVVGGGSGAIPTIAANPAPLKIRPENPGGMQVPNQGRLVYGVVDGSAGQPRMERLLPETEQPVDVNRVLKRPVPETSSVAAGAAPRGIADPPPLPPKLSSGAPRRLIAPAPTSAVPARPAPPPAPTTPVAAQELAKIPSAGDVANLRKPPPPPPPPQAAVRTAPTSLGMAPANVAAQPPSSLAAATARTQQSGPRPTPVPASPSTDLSAAFRIQLAAARSEEAVKSEWDNIRRRNIDLLGELALQVARVDLGPTKGVFYRLRVGPLSNETAAKT
ncbi:MAG: SPOR domain-containing protein, partial [Proteobacteria bacterium]|nr:SPOR domain-containing protein [Pseudomonadota bacterium]